MSRTKSFDFPDRLIRHSGNSARIDPYPFDLYQDSMWQLVQGWPPRGGTSAEHEPDQPGTREDQHEREQQPAASRL